RGPGRNDTAEMQTGGLQKRAKLFLRPLAASRKDQHPEIEERHEGRRLTRRHDRLDHQQARAVRHRLTAAAEDVPRPVVRPVVDDLLEHISVALYRNVGEKITGGEAQALLVGLVSACG